jgi:cyclopropane fatty-acyl-phospholipid synthase-like methyltransferase
VAADPLYIIDRHRDFLDSTSRKFPEEYQRRLRQYHLVNHDMSMLPQNQMGFIFSWGYFNYVSMDTMKQYLQQAMSLLRPGGVFMFSYNDGDTPGGAGMAEKFVRSYMPRSFLVTLCQSLGFEIQAEAEHGPAISWLEIRRPGNLETIKAHQVLGEIKRRDN